MSHLSLSNRILGVVWTAVTLAIVMLVFAAGCTSGGAGGDDPATRPAPAVAKITISRPETNKIVRSEWGALTWFVSAEQGNCDTMTIGQATLKPGAASPLHRHPNCDEVLHVVKGTISHAIGDGQYTTMTAGDTVTIPTGRWHHAKNIGTEDAVMIICFSSAHRKVEQHPQPR